MRESGTGSKRYSSRRSRTTTNSPEVHRLVACLSSAKPDARTQARITNNPCHVHCFRLRVPPAMNIDSTENDGCRGRVLVVENASIFREMQSLLLRQAGYEVVTCETPESALRECSQQSFHVILLNADATGIDDPHFIAQLRPPGTHPAVLFIAAVLTVELTRVLTRAGVNAVMQRPVDLKALIGKIDELSGLAAPLPATRYVAEPPKVDSVAPFQPDTGSTHDGELPDETTRPEATPASAPASRTVNSSIPPFQSNSSSPFTFGSSAPFRAGSQSPFRFEPSSTTFRADSSSRFGAVLHR